MRPNILVIAMIAFFSGLPLLLTSTTMAFWLSEERVDIVKIGLIGLVALPYSFKFIWAPCVDRMHLPILTKIFGKRKAWLIASQLGVCLSLFAIANLQPRHDLGLLVLAACSLAFFAATQETIMLGYDMSRMSKEEYGIGEAMRVGFYRIGMIIASAGALYLANFMTWNQVYMVMACIALVGIIAMMIVDEPIYTIDTDVLQNEQSSLQYLHNHKIIGRKYANIIGWIHGAVIAPITDLIGKKNWLLVLLIMFLYKASDNLIGNMHNIFYATVGFSKIEIANASKIFGTFASIIGGFCGGIMITRMGVLKSLFYGCILHSIGIVSYLALCNTGYNITMLYLIIGIEHFTGGLRTTALFVCRMHYCSQTYAIMQLALMSSIITLGRTTFSSLSGFVIDSLGWSWFFGVAALLSLPGLLLVILLKKREDKA